MPFSRRALAQSKIKQLKSKIELVSLSLFSLLVARTVTPPCTFLYKIHITADLCVNNTYCACYSYIFSLSQIPMHIFAVVNLLNKLIRSKPVWYVPTVRSKMCYLVS